MPNDIDLSSFLFALDAKLALLAAWLSSLVWLYASSMSVLWHLLDHRLYRSYSARL